jgi:predicted ester cyclase
MLRVYQDVLEKGNVDLADELIAHDAVDDSPGLPPGIDNHGPTPLREFAAMLHAGFSDITIRVTQILVDGNSAVGRATFQGYHTGEFLGAPATGKAVSWDAIDIALFREGKVREHFGLQDQVGLLRQLGLMPTPEQSPA